MASARPPLTPVTVALASEADVAGWRDAARALALAGTPPESVAWTVAARADAATLFDAAAAPPPARAGGFSLPRDLLATLQTALLHHDPGRFALAYRMVWRSKQEPGFHCNPADADVGRLAALASGVRRDIHEMHAFVRFRKIGESAGGRESFVAWFEPEHHITVAVAAFFRNRFTGMDWLIVTPEASIAWDGEALREGPGGTRADVPGEDAVEEEWRAYYSSIFNPARVKVQAMKSEMPVKYWRNLPEARLIAPLIAGAGERVAAMVAAGAAPLPPPAPAPAPTDEATPAAAHHASLAALYAALAEADRMPRPGFSDRLVPGEGPVGAALLFVGEQPGDVEDERGRPFVGPAGRMLDRALEEAGIDRANSFVTNAVKRFKFEPRGPRRIHSKPSTADIDHYRPWLMQEIRLVAPRTVVALGASAARALTGRTVTIARERGHLADFAGGARLIITIHPSFLLRLPDESGRAVEYGKFVRDLATAAAG